MVNGMMKQSVVIGLVVVAVVLVVAMAYMLWPYHLRGTEVTPPKPSGRL